MKVNNVCIIGGSGFVGEHIAHLLAAQEINLRVPTRHRERAKSLLVLPTADVVEADIHEPAELDQLLVGMEAVINLVGVLNGDFVSTHVELPKKIVAACKHNNISRLLHVSALNANVNGASAYLRSKGEGEKVITESGLNTTIFKPSVIFGPGDSFLNLFANLARRLPVLPLASPNAKLQPISVENVAQIIVSSLSIPATFGQSYDLCGPNIYTLKQLVEYVASIAGHDLSIIGLNDSLSYLQAMIMEILPGKLMTRDNYFSLKVDSICNCDAMNKLEAVFDIHVAALEEVAPLYLAHHMPRERYNDFRDRAGR